MAPYIDSFDIDGDTNCEFWIQGLSGIDDYGFTAIACDGVQLNKALSFGNQYPINNWEWYGSAMPSTIFLDWGDWWLPNTGPKYLGFRRINSPSDTTYGWVMLDFKEDLAGPYDTLFILDYAYSLIPNFHLTAGQTFLNSSEEAENSNLIHFFPNPVFDYLNLNNLSSSDSEVWLSDLNGRLIHTKILSKYCVDIMDVQDLASGIYYLHFNTRNQRYAYTFIKR